MRNHRKEKPMKKTAIVLTTVGALGLSAIAAPAPAEARMRGYGYAPANYGYTPAYYGSDYDWVLVPHPTTTYYDNPSAYYGYRFTRVVRPYYGGDPYMRWRYGWGW